MGDVKRHLLSSAVKLVVYLAAVDLAIALIPTMRQGFAIAGRRDPMRRATVISTVRRRGRSSEPG